MSLNLLQGYALNAAGKLEGKASAATGSAVQQNASQSALYRVCTTQGEMKQAFQINGSVSGSVGLDGVDAKIQWLREFNLNNSEVVIVVYASVSADHVASDAALKTSPLPIGVELDWQDRPVVRRRDAARFRNTYGDGFISEVRRGREFVSFYRCSSSKITDNRQLAASISAHMGAPAGKLSAGMDTNLTNFMQSQRISKTGTYMLNGANGIGFPDEDHLVQFALQFPSNVAPLGPQGEVVLGVKTSRYEDLGIEFE